MSMSIIPDNDQSLILYSLMNTPPKSWLENKTEDQIQEWEKLRLIYGITYTELNAYFSGEPSPWSIDNPNTTNVYAHKKLENFARSSTERWIDLYQLIRDTWKYLTQVSQNLNIDIPQSPGLMLVAILEQECMACLNTTTKYHEYRPRHLYNLYLKDKKIRELRTKSDLSKPEKARLERFDKEADKLLKNTADLSLYWLVWDLSNTVKKRDHHVRRSLNRYKGTLDELDKNLHSFVNRSGGASPKGHKWIKGIKYPLS